jgi:hypothetical protein
MPKNASSMHFARNRKEQREQNQAARMRYHPPTLQQAKNKPLPTQLAAAFFYMASCCCRIVAAMDPTVDPQTQLVSLTHEYKAAHSDLMKHQPLVAPFLWNSGIHLMTARNVCLTHDYDIVYTSVTFPELQTHYTSWLTYLLELTTFHLTDRNETLNLLDIDLVQRRDRRQATSVVTTTSATTSVKPTSTTAASASRSPGLVLNDDLAEQVLLNQLEYEFKSIRDSRFPDLAQQFTLLWNDAPNGIHPLSSQIFFLSGEEILKVATRVKVHEYLQPKQIRDYQSLASLLKNSKRQLRVDSVLTEFTERDENSDFDYLIHSLEFIQERLSSIEGILGILKEHKLPSFLYDDSQLTSAATQISTKNKFLTVGQTLSLMERIPTTFTFKDTCGIGAPMPRQVCPLYFATFIPVVKQNQVYKEQKIHTLPTYHKGYITNDWVKFDIPDNLVLTREDEVIPITTDDLVCLPASLVTDCDVCVLRSVSGGAPSKCIQALMAKDNPYPVCEQKKLTTVSDQSLILDDNTLAYTDVVPGTVTEKCPERVPRKISLLPTGIIHFNDTCQYTITNGPFQRSQVPKFVELIFNKFLHELDLSRSDKDSILGEHW